MSGLTGDEVMAIFREPGQAVACALALQEAVRPHLAPYGLGAGVGLHCGEVVEGLFGTSNKKVFSVMGMAVNIAKRLEGCAGAGEVVVSEALWRQVEPERDVVAKPLDPVALKGVPEPVRIYEIATAS
jgi:class 3 adenylate cyclase